jgi:hypothetical protein
LSKNFPGRRITSIHMEYLVLRTISLVHINYGLIESLIEITYLYDHQNRIQYINIKLVNMWIYTPHILHSSSCKHIWLPQLQLVCESLAKVEYFPSVCRLCFAHQYHHLTTYIMGIKDLHKRYYPSFI